MRLGARNDSGSPDAIRLMSGEPCSSDGVGQAIGFGKSCGF